MSDLLDEWTEATAEPLSLEQMDARVVKLSQLSLACDEAKKLKKEVDEAYDKYEAETLELLQKAGKTKYQVDGLGTIYQINRFVTRTPKEIDAKKLLFDWIKNTKGPDTLMGLVSINSQTLNAFVNAEIEANPGTNIPGLEAPIAQTSLGFRKEKK